MTKVFLSVFYFILFFLIYQSSPFFLNASAANADFVMFASPFSLFLSLGAGIPIVYGLELLTAGVCIFKPTVQARVTAGLLFLILISIKSSYGKIHHSEHIWMLFACFACFISDTKRLTEYRNLLVLRLMQTTLLSLYFISGLWKIRSLGFSGWQDVALEHIAYSIAEGGGPSIYVNGLLSTQYSWVIGFGFALTILFQMSVLVPIIVVRFFTIWGVLSIVFHFSTGLALNIWFQPMALGALFILIFSERLLSLEREAA